MHQVISENTTGRDFAVGDIHGCYRLLMDQLTYVGFDQAQDRLFSVGDIIDRGPDSLKCLRLLQEPWFYMVRGNHEDMMINACSGGESYNWWASYGSWAKRISPEDMNAWARRLAAQPLSITLPVGSYKVGICHAETDGQDWDEMIDNPESENAMLWGRRVLRSRPDYDVKGVKITIHGHTPLEHPIWVGNRYFMDTGACESGLLTVRKIADVIDEFHLRSSL